MLCYSFIVLLYFTNFGVKHGYVPRRSLYLRTSTSRNYGCITNHKHNYFSNKQNLSSKKFQLFSSTDKAENGVTIRSLVDHQLDGRYLKESVIKWLDEEWIAQEVHKKLGEEVERIYVSNREKGVSDLGEIVMNTGTAFESFDLGDAYVNSWDIANKVSDFLMVRLDREVCCSGDLSAFKELSDSMEGIDANGDTIIKMITPKKAHFPPILVDTKELQTASRVLESEFARYKLMKDFLDDDVTWKEMYPVLTLCLGFREKGGIITQMNNFAPIGWENLSTVPDFGELNDEEIAQRMAKDIPEDEGGTDVVMESLAGVELYQVLKTSGDPSTQRKILVTKWMYVHGFLNKDFPLTEKYIPDHLADDF